MFHSCQLTVVFIKKKPAHYWCLQESSAEGLRSQLGSLSGQLTEVSEQLEEKERELSQLDEKYRTEVLEWGEERGREREEREEEGRQAAEKLRSEVESIWGTRVYSGVELV